MSDWTYRWTARACRPVFQVCSKGLVLHAQRAALTGGYILAATHLSPFDAPLLVGHCPRAIDFLSIVEFRDNPLARRFLSLFNVFYLDRSRSDPRTLLAAARAIGAGRVLGMFPEGNIRRFQDSALAGGDIRPGVARIARIAAAPVIPAVVLGGERFSRASSWLPPRRTRYGVIFGQPLRVETGDSRAGALDKAGAPDKAGAQETVAAERRAEKNLLDQLKRDWINLKDELAAAMER